MSVESKQVAALRRGVHPKRGLHPGRRINTRVRPDDKPVVLDLVYRAIGGRHVLICVADPLPPAFLVRWQNARRRAAWRFLAADTAETLIPILSDAVADRIAAKVREVRIAEAARLPAELAAKYLDWSGR